MGGKDRNRHASKKGTVPKMPVVGVTERSTGRVKAVVMPQPTCYTVQQWLQGAVSGTAILYSDQAAYYPGAAVAHHASVNHSRKEYVRGTGSAAVHTNGIEGHWSLLKRTYHGTHHWYSRKHMQRYVDEYCGRRNLQDLDTAAQLRQVASYLVGTPLRWQDLTD